ncbi:MAG: alpha/beta fold hydrolase [bacterium]
MINITNINNNSKIFNLILYSSLTLFLISILVEVIYTLLYLYNITIGRTNKLVILKFLDVHSEADILDKAFEKEKNKIKDWLDNTMVKGLKITGYNNTLLFAECFESRKYSNKWVIILHGYGSKGTNMYSVGRVFNKKGFNILLPDLRGHGLSGANYVGMGWHDRFDVISWINNIIKINKDAEIIIYGVSMGASTALMTSGEELPKNVKCIISDSAYTTAYEVLKHQLKKVNNMPVYVFLDSINNMCKVKNGFSLKQANTVKQVSKSSTPILFIHGSNDSIVPTKMVFDIYKNANCKKHIIIFKNIGHTMSSIINKKKYWEKIFIFIDKYTK